MPVYSYACKDCGHAFDQRQSFADAALTVCPQCAGQLRKRFDSIGVVFKGSGFYRTDSRAEARSARTPAAAPTPPAAKPTPTPDKATTGSATGSDAKSTPAAPAGQAPKPKTPAPAAA